MKKAKTELNPATVDFIMDQFKIEGNFYYTKIQVSDTLTANSGDTDRTVTCLIQRKEKADKKGKGNIKGEI